MTDQAWYRDPRVLATRPLEFFPMRGMTAAERLNSMVRFVVYAAGALAAYRGDADALWLGLAAALVLSLLFAAPAPAAVESTTSRYANVPDPADPVAFKECTPPTPANPFMNVLTSEYAADKPAACAVSAQTLERSQTYFEQGLPREISDVYRNRASDRQFVTMPVSGNNGTPDTLAFRNYLFSQLAKGPKCK